MFIFFFNNIEKKESKKEKKTLCRKNALPGKGKSGSFFATASLLPVCIKRNKEVFSVKSKILPVRKLPTNYPIKS
jgi:hypothetical protein